MSPPRPVLVSSPRRRSSTTKSSTHRGSLSGVSTRRTFAATFSTADLPQLARETRRKIKWDRILHGGAAEWKWLENARNFSIYTKQSTAHSASAGNSSGVLAIGTIRGSVPEIASLLASSSQPEYEQKMRAIHGKHFKRGSHLSTTTTATSEPGDDGDEDDGNEPKTTTQLSVKTATFAKTNWLCRDDEWLYLEATTYDAKKQRFEKLITTLRPEDVLSGTDHHHKKKNLSLFSDTNRLRDVVCGYRVQPGDTVAAPDATSPPGAPTSPVTTRVHFYAELVAPSSSGNRRFALKPSSAKNETSAKAIQQRLLKLATSCDRLSQLVRRRRLGIQVLVDKRRVALPSSTTTTRCFNCDRMQLVAKMCRVCGQGVCSDCSAKYERETHGLRGKGSGHHHHQPHGVRVEIVRVCDPCMARVESANYENMSDAALNGLRVFPDPVDKKQIAAANLQQLLHDALLQAPSPQRKSAVMSVIRCVLDQEKAITPPITPSTCTSRSDDPVGSGAMLSPLSHDQDYIHALDYLDVKTVLYTEAEISDTDGRKYPVNPKAPLEAPLPFPVTDDEDQRLFEIQHARILDEGSCDELNIICDIAAKEMDAFATIVTIITHDQQHVVAANVPALEKMVMKREDSFCQHTIMGTKPLIVQHPESDVRFSRIMPVTGMAIRYYCGFPLVAGDGNTVIGTLCCVDQKSHEITESQFSALQKLADTAAKVVKIQGDRRRNSAATLSQRTSLST